MWKHFISDYLSFSKRDRTGIFVLLLLILFFILLPYCYPYFIKQKIYDHSAFEKAIASLKIKQEDSSDQFSRKSQLKYNYKNYDQASSSADFSMSSKGELFYFDPNTTSPADWKRLGIREKTIGTIQNYLSKGGKFYKKEDIGKIWGMHENDVRRLMPYVQIKLGDPAKVPLENLFEKKGTKKAGAAPNVIDINNADTTAFIALPGIGSKLSLRIINFREKLGGFYKVEQIGETYGLADSTFQRIKPYLKANSAAIRKININVATTDEMKAHPYLRFSLANAIVQYRNQHGNYMAVDDIKKLMMVTDEIFIKLAPYLSIK